MPQEIIAHKDFPILIVTIQKKTSFSGLMFDQLHAFQAFCASKSDLGARTIETFGGNSHDVHLGGRRPLGRNHISAQWRRSRHRKLYMKLVGKEDVDAKIPVATNPKPPQCH